MGVMKTYMERAKAMGPDYEEKGREVAIRGVKRLYAVIFSDRQCDFDHESGGLSDLEITLVEDFLEQNFGYDLAGLIEIKYGLVYSSISLHEYASHIGIPHQKAYEMIAEATEKLREPVVASQAPKLFYNADHRRAVSEIVDELNTLYENPVFERERQLRQRLADLADYPYTSAQAAQMYPVEASSMDIDVRDLGLSNRTRNALWKAGIRTLEAILNYPSAEWPQVRNLGPQSIKDLTSKMRELGYTKFYIPS